MSDTKYPIILPEVNTTNRLFFNRMPKCGSELTISIFKVLARKQGWLYPAETTIRREQHHRRVLGAEIFYTDSNNTLGAHEIVKEDNTAFIFQYII